MRLCSRRVDAALSVDHVTNRPSTKEVDRTVMTDTSNLHGQIFINAEELELLYALRELCPAFNQMGAIFGNPICERLQIDGSELLRRASFLHGYQLVWLDLVDVSTSDGPSWDFNSIALSTYGESYLRAIDAQPSIGKRVTLSVFGGLRATLVEAGRAVLSALVTQGVVHLTSPHGSARP